MNETLCLQELEQLYARLLPEEREELLQCLLVAAARGGEEMIEVLEQLLLSYATEELLGEPLMGEDPSFRAAPSDGMRTPSPDR